MKTLFKLKKEKERFKRPKYTDDLIPIKEAYDDGIFLLSNGKYSKSYIFTDINYQVASEENKQKMFIGYSQLLNSFDSGVDVKISIINKKINTNEFKEKVLITLNKEDGLDKYREEYNSWLLDQIQKSNEMIQLKMITISISKPNYKEAQSYFNRITASLQNHFSELGSICSEITLEERYFFLHDFFSKYNTDKVYIKYDMKNNIKNKIAPYKFLNKADHFYMGVSKKCGRVFYLKKYANFIKDTMIQELTDLNRNIILSIDIVPIPMDEAIKEAENRRLGIETNITNWVRKQTENGNYSINIPYDMQRQREESKEFLDDLTIRDQRMFLCVLTVVAVADTQKELENITDSLKGVAGKNLCELATLKFQQIDGLNTVLPIGIRKIESLRTLTTESLAVLIPFKVQEISHENGICYGQNAISKNLILINRKKLLNGNAFYVAVSGAGKSFIGKNEFGAIRLSDPKSKIIYIDPEGECSNMIRALGGEVIRISPTSSTYINAMDINSEYADGANPIVLKSDYILSMYQRIKGEEPVTSKEKSILDRCIALTYRNYMNRDFSGIAPTLVNLREEVMKQQEPEAKEIALALELFTCGSLNTFAKQTNVNLNNNLISYDISGLGKQLMPIGMLTILDNIFNDITRNKINGITTYIYIDEIYLLFLEEYSANFLFTLWKRARKYGAFCTGITQNIEDMLQSHTARTMLANSELLVMLNQASTDRIELGKLLNMSDTQMKYITNVGFGKGLIKVGSNIVPFENRFPKDTELYKLMTTKPGESE